MRMERASCPNGMRIDFCREHARGEKFLHYILCRYITWIEREREGEREDVRDGGKGCVRQADDDNARRRWCVCGGCRSRVRVTLPVHGRCGLCDVYRYIHLYVCVAEK